MYKLLDAIVRGIQTGSIYALVGLGINIIFAATSVFNFAQGELVMVGSMLGVSLWVSSKWPAPLVLVVVMLVTAGIGGAAGPGGLPAPPPTKHPTPWILSPPRAAPILPAVAPPPAPPQTGG